MDALSHTKIENYDKMSYILAIVDHTRLQLNAKSPMKGLIP